MNRTDKFVLTVALTLIFSIILLSFEGFALRCDDVRKDTLRLHIIANSDSEADQSNKLLVRDAVLAEYSQILSGKTKEQAIAFADFLKDDIKLTAEKTLYNLGCEHKAKVEIVNMYFDTKSYQSGITLPAGEYAALRITIGEGKGHNWWCVMYPPLCIPACSGEQAQKIEHNIRELEQQPAYKAKFAIIEFAEQAAAFLKK